MKANITLMCWAIAISFVGSLPLGTLNLGVSNYIFHHNLSGAIGFAAAAVSVEMLLVRLALAAIKKLEPLKRFYAFFSLLTCFVLLLLALTTLSAAWHMQQFKVVLPFTTLPPVAAGLLLSLINPLHIPFWMGWTVVLKSKKILDDQPSSYNRFVVAIGVGTTLAFILYGIAGIYVIKMLSQQQVLLNWMIGIILLVTALVQLYKMNPWGLQKQWIMKTMVGLTAIVVFMLLTGGAAAPPKTYAEANKAVSTKGFSVVELFTSEGCSSCPPADAALANIAKAYPEQVVALSFHVDYWNRLGWKDPYSKAAYSQRQKAYANTTAADGIYTPQAIVNGTAHVVGSQEQQLKQLIDKAIAKEVNEPITLHTALAPDGHTFTITYQYNQKPNEQLHIALLQRSTFTDVAAGENRGHRLAHINVVRDFKTVTTASGNLQMTLPASLSPGDCAVAAYVQEKETMRITATTALTPIQ